MTIDEARLKEIEERCEAATPGPWRHSEHPYSRHVDGPDHINVADVGKAANAELIAHARQDLPDLAKEVRRLRGVLEEIAYGLEEVEYDDECAKASGLLDIARDEMEGDNG